MSAHADSGKTAPQSVDKLSQRLALARSASIGRRAAVIERPAGIGYAYRAGIVAAAVSSGLFERPSLGDSAVGSNEIMIAYCGKSAATVPCGDIGHGDGASARCGRAMDDDGVYCSHNAAKLRRGPGR